eukprot:s4172_g3.t1
MLTRLAPSSNSHGVLIDISGVSETKDRPRPGEDDLEVREVVAKAFAVCCRSLKRNCDATASQQEPFRRVLRTSFSCTLPSKEDVNRLSFDYLRANAEKLIPLRTVSYRCWCSLSGLDIFGLQRRQGFV